MNRLIHLGPHHNNSGWKQIGFILLNNLLSGAVQLYEVYYCII